MCRSDLARLDGLLLIVRGTPSREEVMNGEVNLPSMSCQHHVSHCSTSSTEIPDRLPNGDRISRNSKLCSDCQFRSRDNRSRPGKRLRTGSKSMLVCRQCSPLTTSRRAAGPHSAACRPTSDMKSSSMMSKDTSSSRGISLSMSRTNLGASLCQAPGAKSCLKATVTYLYPHGISVLRASPRDLPCLVASFVVFLQNKQRKKKPKVCDSPCHLHNICVSKVSQTSMDVARLALDTEAGEHERHDQAPERLADE